jgi:hypothetical protein
MGTNFYWAGEPCIHCGERPRDLKAFVPKPAMEATWEHPDFDQDQKYVSYPKGEYYAHIGKRSAAGLYCWDCERTLCRGGESQIHTGKSDFAEVCHICGGSAEATRLSEEGNPAGVELGFAKTNSTKPAGVRGACSFSWAQSPSGVKAALNERLAVACVQDEYGRSFTGMEFLAMLENQCPIESTDSIGIEFC